MKKSVLLKRTKVCAVLGALILLLGFALLGGSGALIAFSVWSENAEVDANLLPTAAALPVFLDSKGNKIEYQTDDYMSVDEVPELVREAFVALEDKRFYQHEGYDTLRMAGAMMHNIESGSVSEGASTITQQLVKNTHLNAEKTFSRKLNEIAISKKIEEEYSKDEILSMYLSVIYFGGGAYGVKAASRLYFDKSPDELTLSECACLAGIVKNPSGYSPKTNILAAERRRNLVLDVMCREGYIAEEECAEAKSEDLSVARTKSGTAEYGFYIDRVINEVTELLHITRHQLNNSGLTILTNLDKDLQDKLVTEAENSANFATSKTDNETVIIENGTGKVLAHHSSLGFEASRQAGSTLKPLVVYAPAINENAVSLASPITDEPTDFGGWSPSNYNGIYYGDTNPREAIVHSMNTVAAKTATYIGTEKMLEYGLKFGLSLNEGDATLPLSLGSTLKGNTPLSIAAAYQAVANNGTYLKPRYVFAVSEKGQKIYQADNNDGKTEVVDSATAFLLTDCLKSTVERGTAKTLSALPFEIASKTGTAADGDVTTDAWNVSYTSKHTLVVWHGAGVLNESGGGYPTRHAYNVWKDMYDSTPQGFEKPDGVTEVEVDTFSTATNKTVTAAVDNTPAQYKQKEYFKASNAPDSSNSLFENVAPSFTLKSNKNGVHLTVEVKSAYIYKIMRTDFFGERVVMQINGKDYADGVFKLLDKPFSFQRPVLYTVTAEIKKDDEYIVLGKSEKYAVPYNQ